MKEIVKDIRRWQKQEKKIAVARVIDLDGSGPRLPGAAMAVTEEGEVSGSVSGGCVEGAVVLEALEVIKNNKPSKDVHKSTTNVDEQDVITHHLRSFEIIIR